MGKNTIHGRPVTDERIKAWADEAERGYDVEALRRLGRPRMGSAAARAIAIRIDPEMESALDARVAREGSTRSAVIRDALEAWLQRA